MNSRQQQTCSVGLARIWPGVFLVAVLLGICGAVGAVFGYRAAGGVGILAVVVAASIVWLSAAIALACTACSGSGIESFRGLFAAMAIRFGLPLGAGIVLSRWGGPLADAGVFGWIVMHYLVALAVETPLIVRLVQQTRTASGRI